MTIEEIITTQKIEREKCLAAIISSKSNKKIILAGPGTGKTFTFKEVLKANPEGENIAMTFIRMLTSDMYSSFGDLAEVKTFHAYCKKILHEQNGKVELIPFLSKIIEEDAQILKLGLKDFDKKFQMLDEGSPEVAFYLRRGDYYDSVSFNDSVYRLYKALQVKPGIVPAFNQILIDEYQDFNPLEVAFINELEKKGNILIVGDDDQAVYDGRCASPEHLREKFNSEHYEPFELPFCSRCTKVIVTATNAFLSSAHKKGFLKGRINKRFECFIDLKGNDSSHFPEIITAQCTTGNTVAKYVGNIIQKIDAKDIEESWEEGSEYPTVLIVGPKQYLAIVQKELSPKYPHIVYKLNEDKPLSVIDGYNILLKDESANLGWRILIDFYFKQKEITTFIEESEKGKQLGNILNEEFIRQQKRAIEIIAIIKTGEDFAEELKDELKKIAGDYYNEIVEYYSPKEEAEEEKPDKTKPSILLSSFMGCKGLSAGYVIIVGANNGSIPKDCSNVSDVEIAQFMVALTRTRKQCYIVSNKWHISPKNKGGYQKPFEKSVFLNWLPSKFIKDEGVIKSKDIK
ncbi:MAG: UvrD-helicase domain-containing protein [Nitrospirota bacterium]